MHGVKTEELIMKDTTIKKLFTSTEEGREYLATIVCKILDLPPENFTFEMIHPEIGVNENVVNSAVDIALESNEIVVNVEINSQKRHSYERKNVFYVCQLLLRQIKSSDDYKKKLKKIYQINLNSFNISGDDRFVVVSKMLDVETKQELHPIFEIFDVNLAKIFDKDYTIIKEDKESLMNLLYILVCNKEADLWDMYSGDDLMAKIVEVTKSITDDFDRKLYYDKEALDKADYEEGMADAKLDVAKAMLEENCNIEFIAKMTKLSCEDVEKLKEELK